MIHHKSKGWILAIITVVLIGSNLFNYFYCYKFANDLELQWSVAIYAIAIELFLFSLYLWINESIRYKNKISIVVSGWVTMYLLINLIGVVLGYNLHTKGFMAMLFLAFFVGTVHISIKLWQKYY